MDPAYTDFAYVTFEDLRGLPKLTGVDRETLLAIRAPPGTSLEVPDPLSLAAEEPEKYQIYLHSDSGEILVYVISDDHTQEVPSESLKAEGLGDWFI